MKSEVELFVIAQVKERRQALGISQQQLAYLLDLSIGFIGKVESPKHPSKWNINHLNDLAAALECSPKDFLPLTPLKKRKKGKEQGQSL